MHCLKKIKLTEENIYFPKKVHESVFLSWIELIIEFSFQLEIVLYQKHILCINHPILNP
jgi:hypothetical protein